MAGFDYARSQATALRLIERFGQKGKLVRPTTTGAKPYDRQPGTPERHDAVFAFDPDGYTEREIDGSRIQVGDRRVWVAAQGLAVRPKNSDLIEEADGTLYRIVSVDPVKPATVPVYYTMQVRSGG